MHEYIHTATMNLNIPKRNPYIWYLDSGATEHMTPYISKMQNFRKVILRVQMANKEKIRAEGKGDITVDFSDKNGGLHADLANVLFVPNLGRNLLSVGRLTEKGLTIIFERDEARIIKPTGEIILKAFRKNRLYVIEERTLGNVLKGDSSLWHRRFAHYDNELVKQIVSLNDENANEHEEEYCPVCMLGKMKRSPVHFNYVRSKRPLELIHTDMVGPIEPTSQGGSKYFVSFVDDYSHYALVYPMKSNSEVLAKFDEYRKMAETIHGFKIHALRTEKFGEYLNRGLNEYLDNHDIIRQCMVPEISHKIGIAKSLNQKLWNMTRCVIIESGIPKNLWADALVTACYLSNKCPNSAIDDQIPEALWAGEKVHIEHLRVFGCRAWITLDPRIKLGNLEFQAVECIFIGYSDDIKGYKLWDRKQNIFFISDDVKFDESVFPCKKVAKKEEIFVNEGKSNVVTITVEDVNNEIQTEYGTTSYDTLTSQEDGLDDTNEGINELKETHQNREIHYDQVSFEIEDPGNSTDEGIDEQHTISQARDEVNKNEKTQSKITIFPKIKTRRHHRYDFSFRPHYFVKRKIFPLINSKQKLIKNFKSRI